MKKTYVVGFLFSEDCSHVALIRKNRPTWQAGKLNGIGGKIEEFDNSPLDAMRREFKEETGVDVPIWNSFCTLEGDESVIYCFKSFGDVYQVKTMEDEVVGIWDVEKFFAYGYESAVPNLRWLIPMALEQGMIGSVYHKGY